MFLSVRRDQPGEFQKYKEMVGRNLTAISLACPNGLSGKQNRFGK